MVSPRDLVDEENDATKTLRQRAPLKRTVDLADRKASPSCRVLLYETIHKVCVSTDPSVQCLGARDTSSLERMRMNEMRSHCGPGDDDDGRKGHHGMETRGKNEAGVRRKWKKKK